MLTIQIKATGTFNVKKNTSRYSYAVVSVTF